VKLIAGSKYPIEFSLVRLALLAIFATSCVIAAFAHYFGIVFSAGLISMLLLSVEIDRVMRWRCPNCKSRTLRTVGFGGLHYADTKEKRVYWGQCTHCGQTSIRGGIGFARWKRFSEGEWSD
jgi:DNA-directed RNA polymerase subunit RPC12/RpoP